MTNTTLQDDLAYVRDLAEAGQQAPLLGGRFLTFWGIMTTTAYFLHFSIAAGLFGWPETAYAWVWGVFIFAGLIAQAVMVMTIRDKPGGNSAGNRTEGTVWMAGGFALFAYFGTLIVKSFFGADTVPGFEASLPIVFAIYATGLLTTGIMGGVRVLTIAGYVALGMVAISIWFDGAVIAWGIAALGAFLTVLVPGLILLRNEPKSVV
ncbi:MAG: hypothetical protein AAFV37_05740 [Pseudomonadota bacterium]